LHAGTALFQISYLFHLVSVLRYADSAAAFESGLRLDPANAQMNQALTDVSAKLAAARRLYEASALGDIAVVRDALESRVHPEGYRADDGSNALIAAARANSPSVVQELLNAGAKPNTRTRAGESAQTIAKRNGFDAVVRLLPPEEKPPFGALFGAAAKLAGGVSAAARELAEKKMSTAIGGSGPGAGIGTTTSAPNVPRVDNAGVRYRMAEEHRSREERRLREEAMRAQEEEAAEQRAIESSLRTAAEEEERAAVQAAAAAERAALEEQVRAEVEERLAVEAVAAAEEAKEAEARRAAASADRERLVEQLKAEGNAVFREGRYADAANLYSQAAELDPHNGVLFSNRSGALTALGAYDRALMDANRCVELRPEWPKGHARRAAALHGLKRFLEAVNAYDRALALDPADDVLVTARRQSSFALAIDAE